jgi:hypothetical protein
MRNSRISFRLRKSDILTGLIFLATFTSPLAMSLHEPCGDEFNELRLERGAVRASEGDGLRVGSEILIPSPETPDIW